MNIGFDGKRAVNNYTGLGNYSRGIVSMLSKFYNENQYFLYTPKFSVNTRLNAIINQKNIIIKSPEKYVHQLFPSYWRTISLTNQLKKDRIDLYHGLSNELPYKINLSGIKSIVTIHDLIFLRYPELYKYIDRKIYAKKFLYGCKVADKIIAISNQTKNDVIDFFNMESDKIEVVYNCAEPQFYQEVSVLQKQIVKKKYHLPNQYLLYVGTIEERKNLLTVIKSIKLLQNKFDPYLVVVGKKTKYFKKVNDYIYSNKLNSRIIFLDNVAFADLPSIYQSSCVFLYPSIFEGFGIPIIEAIFSKVPVITSKGGCFAEAGGPSSIYIEPNNENELSEALIKLFDNTELKTEMINNGYSFVQQFREENIAQKMMSVYKKVVHT